MSPEVEAGFGCAKFEFFAAEDEMSIEEDGIVDDGVFDV